MARGTARGRGRECGTSVCVVARSVSTHNVLRTLPLQPGTRRQVPSFKLGIRIPILSGHSAPPYQHSLAAPHHLSCVS
ncbi:hypothetical protein DENSPDRAFT_717842 [Dentipellis sp. KUC8613]|nr:hypothetical protein DENSPDRAFT_717842 [Dentipellis sp. KUC8613]